MLTPEQRVRQLKAYLINQKCVQAAYLFGSVARGNTGPLSDVDVAVLLNSEPPTWHENKMRLMEGLTWIFGVPRVDLVVLNSAEPTIAHKVIVEGQLIFVRDDTARIRTERRILESYLDTAHLRKTHRAAIKEHLKEGEYFD
jgi:predicted nucleotidyltransferase